MYICICNAIREADFRRAATRTAGDAEAVYAALGKRPACGSCLDEADDIAACERARSGCSGRLLQAELLRALSIPPAIDRIAAAA